ncbi:glycosyltransferase [Xylophilus rhododendri]|uniref:Glycosyltransferase n=1 Tax=Xylophilus rhododendri TaxID=2697032 RepID=A0A857J8D5_9BURK|nr:glycosyltransferase [Xylophilus rhododendri]QHI99038.1 glycosyltransferase [Xylophilus rhododendri]
MNILMVHRAPVPVFAYGGTERVMWDLARRLSTLGHRVRFLVPAGSHCDFAEVIALDPAGDWRAQVPADTDVVHLQFQPEGGLLPDVPCLVTEHGNPAPGVPLQRNTVFISADHAARHGSTVFVRNGLDWSAYGVVDFDRPRPGFHFLGKASWRVKNVQGAIDVTGDAGVRLDVLGGVRFNFKRGIRLTFTPRVHFHGMVGGERKMGLLNASRGLVFPVLWHEPFGLAVIESLYFGCPVFGTPYGALPELVPGDCGVLSTSRAELAEAVRGRSFDARACHALAVREFGADTMAPGYLRLYEKITAGECLHAEPPRLREEARRLAWRP